MTRIERADRRYMAQLIAILLGVVLTLGIAGRAWYLDRAGQVRRDVEGSLDAVAELKVGQVANWLDERQDDARYYMESVLVSEEALKSQAEGQGGAARQRVVAALQSMRDRHDYYAIALLDADGKMLGRVPADASAPSAEDLALVARARQEGAVQLSDLHVMQGGDDRVVLDLVVPLAPLPGTGSPGTVLLTVDPAVHLFPMVTDWPTPSASGEALLIRREGGGAVVLSPLRHGDDPPLSLRILPGAIDGGLLGSTGRPSDETPDYRGVPVLSASRPVPGTAWTLVAKVDRDEALVPLRREVMRWGAMAALVFVVAVLLFGFLLRSRRARYYRELFRNEAAAAVEQARAADEIRRLNADLERRVAERTAELAGANREMESFAWSVSHDLRAPLRAIAGFGLAIEEDCAPRLDEKGRDHLRRIRGATERMGLLIDDLLLLSRVTRAEMRRERVDLSGMARDVVDGLMAADRARQVDVTIEDGVTLFGDPRLLRIALENLLGNAWKFTSRSERPAIAFGQAASQDGWACFVRDNGVGFDMGGAARLFVPFQRLHPGSEFPGTGIGLATVQRVIQRHGGRVWAESRAGEGACFWFSLPAPATALPDESITPP